MKCSCIYFYTIHSSIVFSPPVFVLKKGFYIWSYRSRDTSIYTPTTYPKKSIKQTKIHTYTQTTTTTTLKSFFNVVTYQLLQTIKLLHMAALN